MNKEIEIKFTKEELENFIFNLKEINRETKLFTYDSRILISRLQMALDIYISEEHNEFLKKRIATIYYKTQDSWFLKLDEDRKELVDLDTLYDLIKDGLVEKV